MSSRRVAATGYYGDMTRTFLPVAPVDAQRALWRRCRRQIAALKAHSRRRHGRTVHNKVVEIFTARGSKPNARRRLGRIFFTHGSRPRLDVHELPK